MSGCSGVGGWVGVQTSGGNSCADGGTGPAMSGYTAAIDGRESGVLEERVRVGDCGCEALTEVGEESKPREARISRQSRVKQRLHISRRSQRDG